jgi:glycosyltransferase involved in cell wall biosynthesis
MLRRQRPGLRLLLAGRKRMRLDLGGAGLDYRGPLPQSEVARLMSACDVLAVPYLPSPQVQASSPCKLAEYAAVRRPVAATRVSNLAESLAASGHGLCAPGDAADLARAIAAQLASPMLEPYPEGLTWARLAGALERALLDTPGPVGAGRLSRVG